MNQAANIAKILLDVGAVNLNIQQPFKFTSGILSPIYCDNRLVISFPEQRQLIIDAFIDTITTNNIHCDVIAGTATAGIPHAAWIADRLNLPMVYVRGSSKAHGKKNQIEGKLTKGQTALVIEDLVSTGGSAINAANCLRTQGAVVNDCVAIFSYELTDTAKRFIENTIKLHTLTNFSTLVQVATELGQISEQDCQQALTWKETPHNWQNKAN